MKPQTERPFEATARRRHHPWAGPAVNREAGPGRPRSRWHWLLCAILCLLPAVGIHLQAASTARVGLVLEGMGGEATGLRIHLGAGRALPAHLPPGEYSVNLSGDADAYTENPEPFTGGSASVATGMRFQMFLGGQATQVSWSGWAGASVLLDQGHFEGDGDSSDFSSSAGNHAADAHAAASYASGSPCGWVSTHGSATSLAAGYADANSISGVLELRGTADLATTYPCGLYGWSKAACAGGFSASFTLLNGVDTMIVTDTPPGGDGGGGAGGGPLPTFPDQTIPAPPSGCEWQPSYGFNNAPSGGSFALPTSGPAIRFDALDTTRFTAISAFPASPVWVDVDGQSLGPFSQGQSFSFGGFAGGGVTSFSVRSAAGPIPAGAAFQLALDTAIGTFQARVVGPPDVRLDCQRLSAGLPASGDSPQQIAQGESVRFAARVPGVCVNTYQWRLNGSPILGETGATLTLGSVGMEHYGDYSVVVQNELGTAESPVLRIEPRRYTLTVNAPAGTVQRIPDLPDYEPGAVVTLQALPQAGQFFLGWDGDVQSIANPLEITLNQDTTVNASFGSPFGGSPWPVPGRIQAEDFDEGGEGVGYHDADDFNQGGSTYRTGGVDVAAFAEGLKVVWSADGEWLDFTINVASAGTYRAVLRVSTGASSCTGRLRFSGGGQSDLIPVANTGGWSFSAEVASTPFTLPAGLQVLRFEYVQAGFDLDWIELQRVNTPPTANAGGPYTINQGSVLALNGNASHDPDPGDSLTFSWDLNDDGTFGDVTGATPMVPSAWLTSLGLGSGTHAIHLRVTDLSGDPDTASTTLTIRGSQTITFGAIPDHTYGDAPFAISATASSGLPVTFTSLTPSVATVSGNVVTIVAAGTATIRVSQAGDANWQPAADVDQSFLVSKATPVITWATPADIPLGTALSETQLNATANVPGTFTYDPSAGSLLNSGDGQTLTAAFTPNDTVNYQPTLITTTINVLLDVVGSAWAWGSGFEGQLGNGLTDDSWVPVAVTAPAAWSGHTVVSIATGNWHSLAVLDDGSVWAWGYGGSGQLGNGLTVLSEVPIAVAAPAAWNGLAVDSVAAGGAHSLAVLSDGSVWAWGYNGYGQLGSGQTGNQFAPVAVSAPAAWNGHRVVSVAAGSSYSLAVLEDGGVWAWGYGYSGQLGNGQTASSSVPVAVSAPAAWSGHTVVSIAAGAAHSLAVLDDGSVWAWGFGGILGNGQTASSSVPVAVSAPEAWDGLKVANVVAGGRHSLALLEDGSVWAWGIGPEGQLGNGQRTLSLVPVAVSAPGAWSGYRVVAVAAGSQHSLVVLGEPNIAPSLANAIAAQSATYGAAFSLAVPANTFTDPDTGQTLSYSASGLPAWLSFDAETATFSGTPTAIGTSTITVTATDSGAPTLSASTAFDLVVGKAALTATGDRIHRFYGEANPPLTGALEGVVNGDNITATYSTAATPSSPVSVYTIFVTLNDPDSRLSNYEVTKVNGLLDVDPAPQTITFGAIPPHVYGDAPFTVPVSASSGLPVALTSSVASVATVSGTTLTITGAGTTLLTAYQFGGGNYQAAPFVQVSYTVGKATPEITWATPAPIDSSTALSATQLNAAASTAGSFSYDPAAGTVLSRGTHNLSVAFTPTDAANYTIASATVSLTVLNSGPVATAQSVTTAEDTAATITLAGTDGDGDGLTFTVGSAPAHGSLSGGPPALTYTPEANYHGPDSFTFTANDGTGDSAPTTVSITVTPVNDAPVAQDEAYTTAENTLLVVDTPGVLANDTDADAGAMVRFTFAGRVVSADADFSAGDRFVGFYTLDPAAVALAHPDPTLTYQYLSQNAEWEIGFPDRGYRWVASQANTWTSVGNDRPALGDRYTVSLTGPTSAGIPLPSGRVLNMAQMDLYDHAFFGADFLDDDSLQTTSIRLAAVENRRGRLAFGDGSQPALQFDTLVGPFTVTAVNGQEASVNTQVTLSSGARLRVNGNGSFRYDPNGQFAQLGVSEVAVETFTYTVADMEGAEAEATVTITITGLNAPPSAQGQSFTMYDNESAAITLSGSDAETANLTYRIVSGPTAGALSGTAPDVIYTPPFPFAGNDSFTFEVGDAEGATATATVEIAILASDRPPVAVAGPDQSVVAGTDCVAAVTADGSGSSDADGDALSFTWQLFRNGEVVDTVSGQAAVSWSLPHGAYEAVLTVTTDHNGTLSSGSESLLIEVLPSSPLLAALDPAATYAGGPGFNMTLTGGCFLPGAVVHWNGQPRATTVVNSGELLAAIPASDLDTGLDVAVAAVQVVNGDGQVSPALGFGIVAQTVGTADAAVAEAGETSTVSTAPTLPGEPGVTATVENNGSQPVTVLAASYDTRPVGETAFRVSNGAFVDVQVAGADENVTATVFFYYPSTVVGGREDRFRLRYFNGANWIPVWSSGGLPPARDTTDNLDGTVSGGRFAVVFDATSTPSIMEMGGTVFGMFESLPQIDAITGPTGPVALGTVVTLSVDFVALGVQDAVGVNFVWDDGAETTVVPAVAGTASANHLYSEPGVYGVTVQVVDAEGDLGEGRFEYVVVYDPSAGFVTGAGWIHSPAGAYAPDPEMTGTALFGFVSKYKRGLSVPTGVTEFYLHAARFNFLSTTYEWLVVIGPKAQYRGTGKINGQGNYGFILTATDGQLPLGGGKDRLRLKIWDKTTGQVVYDNQRGASDDIDAADPQAIGGGSIVIHKSR